MLIPASNTFAQTNVFKVDEDSVIPCDPQQTDLDLLAQLLLEHPDLQGAVARRDEALGGLRIQVDQHLPHRFFMTGLGVSAAKQDKEDALAQKAPGTTTANTKGTCVYF